MASRRRRAGGTPQFPAPHGPGRQDAGRGGGYNRTWRGRVGRRYVRRALNAAWGVAPRPGAAAARASFLCARRAGVVHTLAAQIRTLCGLHSMRIAAAPFRTECGRRKNHKHPPSTDFAPKPGERTRADPPLAARPVKPLLLCLRVGLFDISHQKIEPAEEACRQWF